MPRVAGWGNYPRIDASIARAQGRDEILAAIAGNASLIARGCGRAYGDAALNRMMMLSLLPSDRILDFDPVTGSLTCEAGLRLADLLTLFVPRGWFVPVTPGTKFVTIGGMIAADVHGKNHHKVGSFGDHVENLTLALADGQIVTCSKSENAELFAATCGGMGLTGIIVTARFRLIRIETIFIRQKTLRAANLDEAMQYFENNQDATYSVAWIDGLAEGARLGRSLIYLGEHVRREEVGKSADPLALPSRTVHRVPFDFPSFVLNRWSVAAFNEIYCVTKREGAELIDLERYFYPLDVLHEWNRIYGKRGFVQYQCVLPKAASAEGIKALLSRIAKSGLASFLAVLKLLGRGNGLLSFPMEGYTLALDFPASPATFKLLNELDAVAADHGGRIYLAKDARMLPSMMQYYPGLEQFRAVRRRIDPEGRFSSLQSERLGL
jgi:decaprenylphospho-beta-D-ribofuranose 2-oxidase